MKVTLIVSGASMAEMGNPVVCLDVNAHRIRTLEAGGMPFTNPA